LGRILGAAGINLTAPQLDQLWRFHQMLRRADAELNLTRIRGFMPMVEKHYLDSLLPATLLDAPLPSPLMDLGSGGGFPGIPLAIAHPQTHLILVEGRRKRAAFLTRAARDLGLRNVTVIARKLNPEDAIPVAGVITRAFAAIQDTLPLVRASLADGALVIFLKGPHCDHEIALAGRDPVLADFSLVQDRHYKLPAGDRRRLVVYRKTASAPATGIEITRIASPDNERVRHWRKLTGGRGVAKHRETLLAGARYIKELAGTHRDAIHGILTADASAHLGLAAICGAPVYELTKPILADLDPAGGAGPVAWVTAPELAPWHPDPGGDGLSLVAPLQLPENLGAVVRAAEALGAREVVVTDESASPFHPRALRASGPAPWRIPLFSGPPLADIMSLAGSLPTVVLDANGTSIRSAAATLPRRLVLILGLEGPGTQALPAHLPRIAIPMKPGVDSLNAAVAAGIALFALADR
jgi:16S rRNA (guanine527-N7)-methyltransferase